MAAAATDLGYRPHALFASIAGGRRLARPDPRVATIGYVDAITRRDDEIARVGNSPARQDAVWSTAAELGYRVELHRVFDYPSSEALERVLLHRGLRALIVTACYEESLRYRLDWSQFIAVSLRSGLEAFPLHRTEGDKYGAMETAYERAWAAGCRRIGAALYRHPVYLRDDDLRRGAYHATAVRRGARVETILEFGPDPLPRGIGHWARAHRLDCVIGFTGTCAWLLREEGVRVPEDVRFVTLHHVQAERDLAGVSDDHGLIQRTAVLRLHQLIRASAYGACSPVVTELVEPVWHDGPSLGASSHLGDRLEDLGRSVECATPAQAPRSRPHGSTPAS